MSDKIIDNTPPINFRDWKDILIRIGIPVGITIALAYFLLPIAIESIVNCDLSLPECSKWGNNK